MFKMLKVDVLYRLLLLYTKYFILHTISLLPAAVLLSSSVEPAPTSIAELGVAHLCTCNFTQHFT
jgi:hypothetical protein